VTACAPDMAAWEAWKASLPPEEPAPPRRDARKIIQKEQVS